MARPFEYYDLAVRSNTISQGQGGCHLIDLVISVKVGTWRLRRPHLLFDSAIGLSWMHMLVCGLAENLAGHTAEQQIRTANQQLVTNQQGHMDLHA